MHEHEKYYNALTAWAPPLNKLATLQVEINSALAGLSEKRVTLEEKMIRMHLHQLSSLMGHVTQKAHEMLPSQYDSLPAKTVDGLNQLTLEIENVVADLNKIIRYNLNFLEQYYEYDYYSRLQNEHMFVSRMQNIVNELQAAQNQALKNTK